MNAQPLGYHDPETIKEDARHHGIAFHNPDINLSMENCTVYGESILLGLLKVKDVGPEAARTIVETRESGGPFKSLADAMERTGLKQTVVENLVRAGAFDALIKDRRRALWEVGLRYRVIGDQRSLSLPVDHDMAPLSPQSEWDMMCDEYAVLGMYPQGHILAMLRPWLSGQVSTSRSVKGLRDGTLVTVAGRRLRRQRPLPDVVFIGLEDEFGVVQLVVWPRDYERLRPALGESLLLVNGTVSWRSGVMNIAVNEAIPLRRSPELPSGRSWS